MDINKRRATKRKDTQMVPQPIEGQTGLVQVDTTWGTIQPIQIDKNIRTVGETELNEYQEKNGDSRSHNLTKCLYKPIELKKVIEQPEYENKA